MSDFFRDPGAAPIRSEDVEPGLDRLRAERIGEYLSPRSVPDAAVDFDWSKMPYQIVMQGTNYDTGPTPNGGWAMAPTGVFATVPNSRCYLDVPGFFPDRPGFEREYRIYTTGVYNTAAVATTGAQWQWRALDEGGNTLLTSATYDPGAPYNATRNVYEVTDWQRSTAIDRLAVAQFGFFQWSGQVTGAVYVNAIRVLGVQGRYVRE